MPTRRAKAEGDINQSKSESGSNGRTGSGTPDGGGKRSGRNERPDPGDGERANARDPAQRASENAPGNASGYRALGGLGVLLMGEIGRGRLVREDNGDAVVGEVRFFQT